MNHNLRAQLCELVKDEPEGGYRVIALSTKDFDQVRPYLRGQEALLVAGKFVRVYCDAGIDDWTEPRWR